MKQKVLGSLCCGFVTMLHLLKWNVGCCKKLRIAKSRDLYSLDLFCILWSKYIWYSSQRGQQKKGWICFSENEYKTLRNDNQENEQTLKSSLHSPTKSYSL